MGTSAKGKRKKKKSAASPYSSWSGTGMGRGRALGQVVEVGFLPLRIITSVRIVLDYVRGTSHRPGEGIRIRFRGPISSRVFQT